MHRYYIVTIDVGISYKVKNDSKYKQVKLCICENNYSAPFCGEECPAEECLSAWVPIAVQPWIINVGMRIDIFIIKV